MEGEDRTELLEARLAEVDLLRRRVLNVIPHALRTPITTFRGLAEALGQASEAEIREQIAPALQRLAAQAEHLLDDMLIAAGVSTALPTGRPTPTRIGATAATVWSSLGGAQRELDVTDGDLSVSCGEGVLFKIFVHLLDNARKYGKPPVLVEATEHDGRVRVRVVDHGSPSPADVAAGFEAFYRGEAAVLACAGLGVGLTVARALAEQSGGSLTLRIDEGRTVAELELPSA